MWFPCAGERLLGIAHSGDDDFPIGVVVVVGGPQYRAGSHRQFVLLARGLARAGYPVLRFDYRGMGDSGGAPRTFEGVHDDIRAAVDAFVRRFPHAGRVVLWGLCDAASAIAFYAAHDPRIAGIVMLNPWVRTEEGRAGAYLRHYYWRRLLDPRFWRKLASGRFDPRSSLGSLVALARAASGRAGTGKPSREAESDARPLPARVLEGLERYRGPVLFVLSGRDLTAGEFKDVLGDSKRWSRLLESPRCTRHDVAAADHTFSRREWSDRVADLTRAWLDDLR